MKKTSFLPLVAGAGMAAMLMMQTALADTVSSSSSSASADFWPSSSSLSSSQMMKPRGYNASKNPYSVQGAKEQRELNNMLRAKLRLMRKGSSSSSAKAVIVPPRNLMKQQVLDKGNKAIAAKCTNLRPRERAACLKILSLKNANRGYKVPPVSSSSVSSAASSTSSAASTSSSASTSSTGSMSSASSAH